MKQILSFTLAFLLLVSMAGCREDVREPQGTPFYYCLAQLDYTSETSAISAEYRTALPKDSLEEILAVYLTGPLSEDLLSPFPADLKLVGSSQEGDTVYLTFSPELCDLSGLDLTIACSCLTLTTLALTDAQQVEIRTVTGLLDGQRAIIMDKNTILLQDTARMVE